MTKLISSYPIDEEFLNENKGLKDLHISCYLSSLKKIPDLSNLTELFTLDLGGNRITSLEGIEVLNSLERLEEITLRGNRLTSLEGFENLDGCNHLRKINLKNNQITDLCDFEPLSHLINLKSLDLSHNQITDINITHEVPTLKSLNLSNNQISQITALKNLPNLEVLKLGDNKITKLGNLENLPKLEIIHIEGNLVRAISDLENLSNLHMVKKISTLGLLEEEIFNIYGYIEELGLEVDVDEGEDLERLLTIHGPSPRQIFKVNEYITLKLREDHYDKKLKTFLYVGGERFNQCSYVPLQIPKDRIESLEEVESIDEVIEVLDKSLERPSQSPISFQIAPEEEFWVHCSNIHAWVENHYDTRLLHRNVAFPLLRRLTQVGDPVAKTVFKEEIAKRYSSGAPSVVEFLKKEGYLNILSKDELSALRTELQE